MAISRNLKYFAFAFLLSKGVSVGLALTALNPFFFVLLVSKFYQMRKHNSVKSTLTIKEAKTVVNI